MGTGQETSPAVEGGRGNQKMKALEGGTPHRWHNKKRLKVYYTQYLDVNTKLFEKYCEWPQ